MNVLLLLSLVAASAAAASSAEVQKQHAQKQHAQKQHAQKQGVQKQGSVEGAGGSFAFRPAIAAFNNPFAVPIAAYVAQYASPAKQSVAYTEHHATPNFNGYSPTDDRLGDKFTDHSTKKPITLTEGTSSKNGNGGRHGGWWRSLTDWWFPHKAANSTDSVSWLSKLIKWRESWQDRQTLKNNRIIVIELNVGAPAAAAAPAPAPAPIAPIATYSAPVASQVAAPIADPYSASVSSVVHHAPAVSYSSFTGHSLPREHYH